MINSKKKNIYVYLFQLCVLANTVFGSDAVYYRYSRIITFLFFGLIIFNIICTGFTINVGKLCGISIAFVLYEFISLLWARNQTLADSQFITQIQLFLLYFFVYQAIYRYGEIKDYLNAIYASGFIMIIFAMVRYGGISNYINIMQTGVRLGGEIANENTFGLIFGNAALSAMYYAIIEEKKVHYLSLIPFVFFGFSSGSKKTALVLCVGFIGLFLLKYGFKRIYKFLIVIVIFAIISRYLLSLPIFSTINDRLTSYLSGDLNTSDRIRSDMINFGIQLFKEHPFIGYGLQNFRNYYPTSQYSHNNFIEILTSLGMFGFILYYSMFIVPIIKILKDWLIKHVVDTQMLMLMFLLVVEMVFGWGMVQFYGKSSWILFGVAHAFIDRHCTQKRRYMYPTSEMRAGSKP